MTFAREIVKQNDLCEDQLQNHHRFGCSLGNQGLQGKRNRSISKAISLRQPHLERRHHRWLAIEKVGELEAKTHPILQSRVEDDGKPIHKRVLPAWKPR